MPRRPAGFRIQARHLFLTYPQCSVDKDFLYTYLSDLPVGGDKPEKICVAQELHQDGNIHYHVFLSYAKRRDITNEKIYDVLNFHPNIQKVRSVKYVLEYIVKDNNYLANFEVKKPTVAELAERAADEEAFIKIAEEAYGTKFVGAFSNWVAYYNRRRKIKLVSDPIGDWSNFRIDDLFLLCRILSVQDHIKDGRRTKSIWLYGKSRTGKTSLARSIGRHVYMGNTWNVDLLDDDADYLILDDIDFEKWGWQMKALLGCQRDVSFTGKYFRPKKFTFNIPCIVLSNEKPFFTPAQLDWLTLNVDFFEINDVLY